MRQAPWILGSAIIFGTGLGTLPVAISIPSLIFLGVGICILLLFSFSKISHTFLLVGFLLFIGVFCLAQTKLTVFNTLEPAPGTRAVYRVIQEPLEKAFYQQIMLRPEQCSFAFCEEKEVLWQAPIAASFTIGEKVLLECDLSIPENFTEDFNYRLYLAKEGVGYLCEEEKFFEGQAIDSVTRMYQAFLAPKVFFENALSQSIPEPEAGLAKGLLLGGSDYLSTTTEEQFTQLGLSHIVAVSGYNIVIIVNALLALGILMGLWRKSATWFAFVGILFFILMIGSPASAVRAGIMALAAFGAFLIGRVTYSLSAILVTAAAMVLWNPLVLWYDAGFQLSFLATVAVVVSLRFVEDRLSEQPLRRTLQEIVWLAVWVYIFLLPILLFQFKTLTILSIPANILFLPVVPFAMMGSFLVAILHMLVPALSSITGWLAYIPLTYIMKGTYFLSNIPGMTIPLSLPLILVTVWYIFLLFVIVAREERRLKKNYEKNFSCPHQH